MKHFITHIHIDEVRHLKGVDIELDSDEKRHLILTGKNGSGKTSLLEAVKENLRYLNGGLCSKDDGGNNPVITRPKDEESHGHDSKEIPGYNNGNVKTVMNSSGVFWSLTEIGMICRPFMRTAGILLHTILQIDLRKLNRRVEWNGLRFMTHMVLINIRLKT